MLNRTARAVTQFVGNPSNDPNQCASKYILESHIISFGPTKVISLAVLPVPEPSTGELPLRPNLGKIKEYKRNSAYAQLRTKLGIEHRAQQCARCALVFNFPHRELFSVSYAPQQGSSDEIGYKAVAVTEPELPEAYAGKEYMTPV